MLLRYGELLLGCKTMFNMDTDGNVTSSSVEKTWKEVIDIEAHQVLRKNCLDDIIILKAFEFKRRTKEKREIAV